MDVLDYMRVSQKFCNVRNNLATPETFAEVRGHKSNKLLKLT